MVDDSVAIISGLSLMNCDDGDDDSTGGVVACGLVVVRVDQLEALLGLN